jgi:hypothetical protein
MVNEHNATQAEGNTMKLFRRNNQVTKANRLRLTASVVVLAACTAIPFLGTESATAQISGPLVPRSLRYRACGLSNLGETQMSALRSSANPYQQGRDLPSFTVDIQRCGLSGFNGRTFSTAWKPMTNAPVHLSVAAGPQSLTFDFIPEPNTIGQYWGGSYDIAEALPGTYTIVATLDATPYSLASSAQVNQVVIAADPSTSFVTTTTIDQTPPSTLVGG